MGYRTGIQGPKTTRHPEAKGLWGFRVSKNQASFLLEVSELG